MPAVDVRAIAWLAIVWFTRLALRFDPGSGRSVRAAYAANHPGPRVSLVVRLITAAWAPSIPLKTNSQTHFGYIRP